MGTGKQPPIPQDVVDQAKRENCLELAQSRGCELKRKGARENEHAGPCPACGGTDRFVVADSWFLCRGCHPAKGDAVALAQHLGLADSFVAAVRYLVPAYEPDAEKKKTGGLYREAPAPRPVRPAVVDLPAPPEPKPELDGVLAELQAALTEDSPGGRYLAHRGFPLELARRFGLGWAACGKWPHNAKNGPVRQWKWGRLVFPHTDPADALVSLYGRACGKAEQVPKPDRHDHLPGPKGNFNAAAWRNETVFVCEGAFDALAMIAAGHENTVAIFGVDGLRWEWARAARRIVFCFDQDEPGRKRAREQSMKAMLAGKQACTLPAEVYGEHKDLAEVWQAEGKIDLGALLEDLADQDEPAQAEAEPLQVAPDRAAPADPAEEHREAAPAEAQEQGSAGADTLAEFYRRGLPAFMNLGSEDPDLARYDEARGAWYGHRASCPKCAAWQPCATGKRLLEEFLGAGKYLWFVRKADRKAAG